MLDDLISRQAAIECLSNLRCGANCFDEEERSQYTALSHAIAEIELLPSAQPEPDCVLKEFGNCSYSETGCSDCKVKVKIRNALSVQPSLQPTCNQLATDCISRQAAIDKLDPLFESLAIDKIKALPSAQPEPRWIPVTERLPEPMGWDKSYLVSLAWGGVGAMEYKSTGFHNYGSFSPVPIETVTAWMPLPEPYAERREDG